MDYDDEVTVDTVLGIEIFPVVSHKLKRENIRKFGGYKKMETKFLHSLEQIWIEEAPANAVGGSSVAG